MLLRRRQLSDLRYISPDPRWTTYTTQITWFVQGAEGGKGEASRGTRDRFSAHRVRISRKAPTFMLTAPARACNRSHWVHGRRPALYPRHSSNGRPQYAGMDSAPPGEGGECRRADPPSKRMDLLALGRSGASPRCAARCTSELYHPGCSNGLMGEGGSRLAFGCTAGGGADAPGPRCAALAQTTHSTCSRSHRRPD